MANNLLEPFFSLLLLAAGLIYLAGLERVRRGLLRLRRGSRGTDSSLPFISVIIPCRNEAEHIGAALDDLTAQDYPADRLQVIVVDDRSDDGTGEVARSRQDRLYDLMVLRIDVCPDHLSPKKHALARGLAQAKGEILITSDGDCRFSPGWIRSLAACFTPRTGLVTGLTIFDRGRPEPFWQRLQQLDYLSHSFFAAGAIGSGWALNCNGSNLALRRETFVEAGGYGPIGPMITGDDTLLLQRIHALKKWDIAFSADPASLVRSWPEETPAEVFHQRLRWGSGGMSYSPPARAFALITFIFFLGLFLSLFLSFPGWIGPLWIALWGLKMAQEIRVMRRGFKVFGLKADWCACLILEIIHIPAILTFSLGGHLLGFRWKGQKFKRRQPAAEAFSEVSTP
jgi:cellulose synthase/poly-beta-1,6-N-acetylglucosamine synthase-like glycosyltransferase